jgi:AcrR family transcriptional regulator
VALDPGASQPPGAGVPKETLYRHFGWKDGLIEAVLDARSDRVVRWLQDAAGGAATIRPVSWQRYLMRWPAGTPSPGSAAARPCSTTPARPRPPAAPPRQAPRQGNRTGLGRQ